MHNGCDCNRECSPGAHLRISWFLDLGSICLFCYRTVRGTDGCVPSLSTNHRFQLTEHFDNRLTSVTLPGSGGTVSFKYDPFGRRIYKSSSSGTSIYAYDGDNLIEETNSSGTAVARYAQVLRMDQQLAMLRSSTTSYYEADGLGSITSLSNGAGSPRRICPRGPESREKSSKFVVRC